MPPSRWQCAGCEAGGSGLGCGAGRGQRPHQPRHPSPAQPSPAQPSSPHLEAGWVRWHTTGQHQPCTPPLLCPAAQYSGAGHRSGRSCDGSQLSRSGPITPAGLGWAGLGCPNSRGGESEISLWKIFNNKVLGKAGIGWAGWLGWVKMCYQNLVS